MFHPRPGRSVRLGKETDETKNAKRNEVEMVARAKDKAMINEYDKQSEWIAAHEPREGLPRSPPAALTYGRVVEID